MNKKDFSAIIALGIIVAVIATVALNALFGFSDDRQATINVVDPVSAEFSNEGKSFLLESDKADYSVKIDYKSSLFNPNPFGR